MGETAAQELTFGCRVQGRHTHTCLSFTRLCRTVEEGFRSIGRFSTERIREADAKHHTMNVKADYTKIMDGSEANYILANACDRLGHFGQKLQTKHINQPAKRKKSVSLTHKSMS